MTPSLARCTRARAACSVVHVARSIMRSARLCCRAAVQLIGTVIGVLLNGIIPEWAITLPLFIMLALMFVQTSIKG